MPLSCNFHATNRMFNLDVCVSTVHIELVKAGTVPEWSVPSGMICQCSIDGETTSHWWNAPLYKKKLSYSRSAEIEMGWFEQTTAPVKVVSRHQDPEQTGKRKNHPSCMTMLKAFEVSASSQHRMLVFPASTIESNVAKWPASSSLKKLKRQANMFCITKVLRMWLRQQTELAPSHAWTRELLFISVKPWQRM